MKKTKYEKHNIPFLSEWKHKDGGIYTVVGIKQIKYAGIVLDIVLYSGVVENKKVVFARTVEHFKSSFKCL